MKRNALITIVMLTASLCMSAEYYASSIHPERSDNNAGTDSNTPWATFDKVRSMWSSLSPGDTVHLERGSLWGISPSSDYWYIGNGGNASADITIRGDDYGSGDKPILKRVGGSGTPAFIMIEASYVTVRDFTLDGAYQDHGVDGSGIVIGDANGNISHVNVLNMTVKNLGGSSSQYVCGIWLVSFCGYAVSDALIAGNEVSGYSAHGLNHYSQGAMRNITWRGNVVRNNFTGSRFPSANSALQIRSGSEGCIFEYNYLEDTSTTEGNIFFFGKRFDDVDSFHIRYNIVANSSSDGMMFTIDQRDYKVLGDIYGNIIYNNRRAGIAVFPADSYAPGSVLRFYNNTLYDNYTAGGSDSETGEVVFDNNTSNTDIQFFNNLVYHPVRGATVGLAVKPPFAGTYSHGNNLYWHAGGSGYTVVEHNVAYTTDTVLNYEPSAQNTDPLFQNTAELPTVVSSLGGAAPDGLLPQAGSAAIDNGIDLGTAFAGSIDNIPRPYGVSWDIGAYEAGDLPEPLSSPTDLISTALSTNTIALIWVDNADDETGFRIEQRPDGGDFAEIAITRADVTSYTDSELTSDTLFAYRVRAYRNSTHSEYSNIAQTRTLAPPDETPPLLVGVEASDNPRDLIVSFSEPLEPATAQNPGHYALNRSIQVIGVAVTQSIVTLTVQPSLSDSVSYALAVSNITDVAGNPIAGTASTRFTYAAHDAALVAWYPLNGSAVDLGPLQNDGAVSGAIVVTDSLFNQAYRFDGAAAYIEIPLQGLSAAQGTISMWIYPYGFSGTQYIFGHTAQEDWAQRIQIYTDDATGQLDLGVGDSHEVLAAITALQVQQWQHLALTWDAGNCYVYVDGVMLAQAPYSGLSALEPFADIGNNGLAGSKTEAFDGVIDDVRIYARPLSGPKLQSIAKSLHIPRRPELLGVQP